MKWYIRAAIAAQVIFVLASHVAIAAAWAFAIWYHTIPTPDQHRWETYCYCDGERAQAVNIPFAGKNNWFVKIDNGQPGWWYLRGEPRRESGSCLLYFYWWQRDLDGDGEKEKGFPHAEYVDDDFNPCCTNGGF